MVSSVYRYESYNSLLDCVITHLIKLSLLYKRLKNEFDGINQKFGTDDLNKRYKPLSSSHESISCKSLYSYRLVAF